ncbi:hypothetical protein QFC21_003780 [Naganishia friedmannii]|uniref:Uncharacterized protein n=1 Tax=Naganishia friedmannii TaxID=89922 RepID=A0ACC2VMK8_9TREE|nr:hypothetical protein QFC21_003780 [Naganishia friedmannii]
MAADIARFMRDHGLAQEGGKVNLMGHSMGGKAVMAFALNSAYNGCLHTLISADMAPSIGKISPEFASYAQGMQEIEDAKVRTKAEGDKVLQGYEKSLPTRQFLLTNAITDPTSQTIRFRIPLDIIRESIPQIGEFPYSPPAASASESEGEAPNAISQHPTTTWSGPTLFIKGARSAYINHRNIPACRAFFPRMEMETLDAGHWVHAERPAEFVDAVEKFLRAHTPTK